MTKDEIKLIVVFAGLLIGIVMSSWLYNSGVKSGYERCVMEYVMANQDPQRDTMTVCDTAKIHPSETPAIKDSVTDTEPMPLPVYVLDTCWVHDTCYVYINIEHHHLNVPNIGNIWYSGFQTNIDSMHFYQQTKYITERIEVPVYRTQYKNTISVVAGFQDASLMYTRQLGRFVIGASAGYTYDRQPTARGVVGFSF